MAKAYSEGPPKIHSGIEARDLIRVAVKRQRRAAAELADASFGRLAPSGVINGRVHVRVEAVLPGAGEAPGRRRLFLRQANSYDRLDPLEPILPRNDQP